MESRRWGNTGWEVSRLGLGLAALGRPAYVNVGHGDDLAGRQDAEALERHAHEVLDEAFTGGIRYFDAARSYGRAEEFLAHWLDARGHTPDTVTVGSKWGYTYTGGWRLEADVHEVKEHTTARLDAQFEESRALLGPYLDLYQIHSATEDSGVLENRAVLDRLAELKTTGLAIGFTTSGPAQAPTIRQALEIEYDGSRLFDVVQATWNLLEPSAGEALAEAHAAGLGIIVKEALANGRLASPRSEAAARVAELVPDVGVDALGLAAALRQRWADVVLSGAATVKQLADNLAALRVSPEAVAGLPDLSETPERYWSARASLPWT